MKKKGAIYAGSFDPWSFGHQYVLDAARSVFDEVHVLAAVNPLKQGDMDPVTRARVIAHSISPLCDWWSSNPPFRVGNNVVVGATTGLVVDYAREKGLRHLIRGLRSTSDFEAEFNLYFSNRAIETSIETWCILCPPELLHCSSTFVRSVVGRPHVDFVGTSFLTQSILLKKPKAIGHILDLIQALSRHRFEKEPADLTLNDLNAALQRVFVLTVNEEHLTNKNFADTERYIREFIKIHGSELILQLEAGEYPHRTIAYLWAVLVRTMAHGQVAPCHTEDVFAANWLAKLSQSLGKTELPLFDIIEVKNLLAEDLL